MPAIATTGSIDAPPPTSTHGVLEESQCDVKFSGESTDETTSAIRLGSICREYRGRLAITWILFNLENVFRLLQPLVLGLAINDLLIGSWRGLGLFVGQHLSYTTIGCLRQMYDTRTYTAIHSDLATRIVVGQRSHRVDVSRVTARSAMVRDYADFLERTVPLIVRAAYSIVGALAMLALYDWTLVPSCLALLLPACLLNTAYGRRTLSLTRGLHDQLEHDVEVVQRADAGHVRRHYDRIAQWRIRLSDTEALNFGMMEIFVMALLVTTLVQFCSAGTVSAGDVFAVFRYVLLFVMGIDTLPEVVRQISRLRDIGTRLRCA